MRENMRETMREREREGERERERSEERERARRGVGGKELKMPESNAEISEKQKDISLAQGRERERAVVSHERE